MSGRLKEFFFQLFNFSNEMIPTFVEISSKKLYSKPNSLSFFK